MCYAKPGPRCSEHASEKLKHARTAQLSSPSKRNAAALAAAEAEYALTPAGIHALRASGLNEVEGGNIEHGVALMKQADTNEGERERLIAAARVVGSIKKMDYLERSVLAAEIATPVEVLEHLAHDRDHRIREDVAANTSTSATALTSLTEDADEWVRHSAMMNPSTPVEVLSKAAKDEERYAELRWALASNPATPPAVLSRLAKDEDSNVRMNVAANPSTRASTLSRLAKDEEHEARLNAASNPSTPLERLERIARDKYETDEVRAAVLTNPSVSSDEAAYIMANSDYSLRFAVARFTSSQSLLSDLSQNADASIRKDVARNPHATEAVLRRLAEDDTHEVSSAARTSLLRHPETVAQWLGMEDDVPAVEALLRDHPSQARSMLGLG